MKVTGTYLDTGQFSTGVIQVYPGLLELFSDLVTLLGTWQQALAETTRTTLEVP